jgi:hypothetical protein
LAKININENAGKALSFYHGEKICVIFKKFQRAIETAYCRHTVAPGIAHLLPLCPGVNFSYDAKLELFFLKI